MNDWERQHRQAQRYKEAYPPGTRLMLLSMNDPHHPVESGTRGTVDHVDDMGTNGKFRIMLSKIKTPPFSLYNQLIYFS